MKMEVKPPRLYKVELPLGITMFIPEDTMRLFIEGKMRKGYNIFHAFLEKKEKELTQTQEETK